MVFYLQDASDGASAAARDPLDSVVVRLQRAGSPTETEMPPPIGRVQFGDLRRLKPISREWGFDRGLPIDRYYVEEFLARHCGEIRGRVLEVGDDAYTGKFGSDQVTSVDILNLNEDSPGTTIVADLANAPQIPSDRFDCIILTQTLQFIYDVQAAVETLYRILKPRGVLLATFPGITQGYDAGWEASWYWSFTQHSARRLFGRVFPLENIELETHGNVLSAVAFLEGLAAEDLNERELDYFDPGYVLSITLRDYK